MGKNKSKKDEKLQRAQRKLTKRALAKMMRTLPVGSPERAAGKPLLYAATEALRVLHRRLDAIGLHNDTTGILLVIKPSEGPAVILANKNQSEFMDMMGGSQERVMH